MGGKGLNDKLKNIVEGLPFKLTEEQLFFIEDFIRSKGHAICIGDSGVGKTTVMWLLHKYYGSSILFGASSGVATVNLPDNIGYATGHKIFNLSVGEAIDKDYKRSCPKILTNSDLIKIIVIDEAFCYNSQDLDQVLNQVRKLNKATKRRHQRDIRLLLVGDPLQRLPIVSDQLKSKLCKKYGHYYMFESTIWSQFNPKAYVLTEVKRQSGEDPKSVWFRKALQVIRYGMEQHYDTVLKGLNKFVVGDNYEEGSLYLAPTNALVNGYNAEYLKKNPNMKFTFKAQFGKKYDQKEFPMEKEVTVAEGCKVLCLVNCPEGTYQNGTEITITNVMPDEGVYGEDENGREIFVPIHEFKQEEIVAKEVSTEDISTSDLVSTLAYNLTTEDIHSFYSKNKSNTSLAGELTKKGMLDKLSRADLTKLYGVKVMDKLKIQEREVVDRAYMLPVKLSAGFVIAKSQGRTFNRKGLIDVGDIEKDYFYTWNKMPDYMVAGLFVALGRFTSIDHIQLKRPIERKHIRVCRTSINFWFKCLREFNDRKEKLK